MPLFGRSTRGASAHARFMQAMKPFVNGIFPSQASAAATREKKWLKELQRCQAGDASYLWSRYLKVMQGAWEIDGPRPLSPAPLARPLEASAGRMPPYQDWVVLDLNAPSRSGRSADTGHRMPPYQDWVVLDPNAPRRSSR